MDFQNISALWLLPLSVFPMIAYFFLRFYGKKSVIPSLVFLKEEHSQTRIPSGFWKFLLQSVAVFFLVVFLSQPRLENSRNPGVCFYDDTLHTQTEAALTRRILEKYRSFCGDIMGNINGVVYSLSDLDTGKLSPLSLDQLHRKTPISYPEIRTRLDDTLQKYPDRIFYMFLPEDNYQEILGDSRKIKIIPLPSPDKNNNYFTSYSLGTHPADYRKLILRFTVKTPGTEVLIQAGDGKILSVVSRDGINEHILPHANIYKPYNIIIKLTGDGYTRDNTLEFPVPPLRFYTFSPQEKKPHSVEAIFRACEDCNQYIFREKPDAKIPSLPMSFHRLESYPVSGDGIRVYWFSGENKFITDSLSLSDGSRILVKRAAEYSFPESDDNPAILHHFTSGEAAVLKTDSGDIIFLFDPDSPSRRELFHPDYVDMLFGILSGFTDGENHPSPASQVSGTMFISATSLPQIPENTFLWEGLAIFLLIVLIMAMERFHR